MKNSILLVVCLSSVQSFAQTDIIELRSRSRALKNYERFSNSKRSDHISSNFGVLPLSETMGHVEFIEPTNAVLDSVKIISDNAVVMYTSRSCLRIPTELNSDIPWRPGADTILDHPLFRYRHKLDSVKMVLDRDYYFSLPADSVKFIGFDNGEVNLQEVEEINDTKMKRSKKHRKSSIGWALLFLIIGPIGIAYFIGYYLIPRTVN